MTIKSDSRLAEFLRRILADDNDAAPADVIFGEAATTDALRPMAQQFASSVHDMGYIEPANGAQDDLQRVRVTPQGQEWLEGYDRNRPTLHPRYSS